ncbi:PREDICTED: RING-H2 finger protein ATL56-like [Camelina sativa]|uniref:RING-H2 finger protein ATL56-like n=1 Tax=Camelina sativa TaxID=90675 RepID=A0ABM0TKX1_CAMSA|nr:PREDICTED: RING-H2 finger protein ATL56-like [Camelina sativa]
MSEIEELVCIDARVIRKSTSNTVEIRVTRRNVITLGSDTTPSPRPFPTPHLLLTNVISFDEDYMNLLLYPTLPDRNLCSILSFEIASEAKRVPGPLYISFDVTLRPEIFEEPDMETCAICLEESQDLDEMPNCSHVFHDYCMHEWLCRTNHCPLCRAVIMDD